MVVDLNNSKKNGKKSSGQRRSETGKTGKFQILEDSNNKQNPHHHANTRITLIPSSPIGTYIMDDAFRASAAIRLSSCDIQIPFFCLCAREVTSTGSRICL